MAISQGRDDTMPSEVQKLDDGFFLLNIRRGKRVTLPDAMMDYMELTDGDMLLLKLEQDKQARVKKFESEILKF